MVEVASDILTRLVEFFGAVQREGIHIHEAYLYGSRASGTPHRDSDIDVAVISPDFSGDRVDDWCRINRIAQEVDTRFEVVPYLPEQFRDEDPLVWEMKSRGIKLIEEDRWLVPV
ncbi:MAG: nucleotidyltransferase domain-containing protein [Dehalococcoidia bacterium]